MRVILLFILFAPLVSNSQCLPPSAQATLDVNNAKVMMQNGGDMWWNLENARYEIPKGSGKHPWFSGALWIAGLSESDEIHAAINTYRSHGYDYYPGLGDSTGQQACADADRIFKLNRHEVAQFLELFQNWEYAIPKDILEWPARGNPYSNVDSEAPFIDVNNDSIYNPTDGDYPAFCFEGEVDRDFHLLGDQCLWWVMNDVGDIHTESGGPAMGLAITCMAYAFESCDAMNDQTFYRYQIKNNSNKEYHDTYLAIWGDPDLGDSRDDYVGCEVMRHLGYVYNGDSLDGDDGLGPTDYPDNPPAAGIKILEGPIADLIDGIDNDRNGQLDELGERLGISKFMRRPRIDTPTGWPPTDYPEHFYRYLSGQWRDGSALYYGGYGHLAGGADSTVTTDFLYPGDSDPQGFGTNMIPQDSWTEGSADNPPGDRRMIVSSGPFTFEAGDTEILHFANLFAWDRYGPEPFSSVEKLFLVSDTIQEHFENGFQELGCCPPIARIGIEKHDKFTFLFSPLSEGEEYAWNFGDGSSSQEPFPIHQYNSTGTYEVCLTATNDCGVSDTCISITIEPEYLSLPITRIEGTGNGGRILDLMPAMHDSILSSPDHRVYHPKYECGRGPIGIDVLDIALFPKGEMRLAFNGVADSSGWKMYEVGSLDTVYSENMIGVGERQLVPQWGMMVSVNQTEPCGNRDSQCMLDASSFPSKGVAWINGLKDSDYPDLTNWVRSGRVDGVDFPGLDDEEHFEEVLDGTWAPYRMVSFFGSIHDPMLGLGVGWNKFRSLSRLNKLASIDLVITRDKSKWTRCVVIETGPFPEFNIGNRREFQLRDHPSVDKKGRPDNSGTSGKGWFPGYAINVETGERLNIMFGENSGLDGHNTRDLVWNPTSTVDSNGVAVAGGGHYIYIMGHNEMEAGDGVPIYDGGSYIHGKLSSNNFNPTDPDTRRVYQDAMWVHVPLAIEGKPWIKSEARVRLRVNRPYQKYGTQSQSSNDSLPLYSFKLEPCSIDDVETSESDSNFLVYPNPSNGTFNFEGPWVKAIRVYDSAGKLIYQDFPEGFVDRIELSQKPGTYFAAAFVEGTWLVKKLCDQRLIS